MTTDARHAGWPDSPGPALDRGLAVSAPVSDRSLPGRCDLVDCGTRS